MAFTQTEKTPYHLCKHISHAQNVPNM